MIAVVTGDPSQVIKCIRTNVLSHGISALMFLPKSFLEISLRGRGENKEVH